MRNHCGLREWTRTIAPGYGDNRNDAMQRRLVQGEANEIERGLHSDLDIGTANRSVMFGDTGN